jgi:hypothetical protein
MKQADNTEARAAEAILDKRVKINIPSPWPLRLTGKKTVALWFRRPTAAQLLRMSAMYVRMNVDLQNLSSGEAGVLFEHVARHGVACSRIIAQGLIRGPVAASLLMRPLASYLLRHMDMQSLAELTKLIVFLSGAENFAGIIRSIAFMKMTAPILSHEKTES